MNAMDRVFRIRPTGAHLDSHEVVWECPTDGAQEKGKVGDVNHRGGHVDERVRQKGGHPKEEDVVGHARAPLLDLTPESTYL